jgi:hypothetical protein
LITLTPPISCLLRFNVCSSDFSDSDDPIIYVSCVSTHALTPKKDDTFLPLADYTSLKRSTRHSCPVPANASAISRPPLDSLLYLVVPVLEIWPPTNYMRMLIYAYLSSGAASGS